MDESVVERGVYVAYSEHVLVGLYLRAVELELVCLFLFGFFFVFSLILDFFLLWCLGFFALVSSIPLLILICVAIDKIVRMSI